MKRLNTSITFMQLVLLYVDKYFVGLLSGGLQETSSNLCEASPPAEVIKKNYIYICRMNTDITFTGQNAVSVLQKRAMKLHEIYGSQIL
jgi:hypothetical protein